MKTLIITSLLAVLVQISFGQISFADEDFYSKRSPAEVISIADFNNDGLDDVALGMGAYYFREDNYRIAIFSQSANGILSETAEFSYVRSGRYSEIKSMCTGDINNDNLQDLIITYDDSLVFYTQSTAEKPGQRLSYFVGNGADNAHCDDLNGDGLVDVAIASTNNNYIRVFYQGPTGFTFKDYQKPNTGRSDIEVGDFNGDGRNDLVVSGQQDNGGLYFYTQNTVGELIYSGSIFRGNAFNSIAVADIDNNGTDDVIFTSGTGYFNAEVGIVHQAKPPLLNNYTVDIIDRFNQSYAVQVFDADCDGKKEVLSFFENDNLVGLFTETANGNFTYDVLRANTDNATKPQASAIGDLNNDGKYDVAFVSGFGFSVFLNQSDVKTSTDTIFIGLQADTTVGTPISENTLFVSTSQDTIDGDFFLTTDTFTIRTATTTSTIRLDSLFQVFGEGCIASSYRKSSTYSITDVTADTTFLSTSTVCLSCEEMCKVFIPNAFTPNGDGINDYFIPVSSCEFLSYHFVVYDKWSEKIFETKEPNQAWDGVYKDGLIKQGVYSYTLYTKTVKGTGSKAGVVSLLK